MDEIYAEHAAQSVGRFQATMERGRYFTGEKALANGIVDRVIERRDPARPACGFGQGRPAG